MTVEHFKKIWQPNELYPFESLNFDLHLKSLEKQIRSDAIDECIKRIDEINIIESDWIIDELKKMKEGK